MSVDSDLVSEFGNLITPCKQSHPMQECGARTRAGGKCKGKPMRNRRCRMHGGASLDGYSHPNYKHGRYCKTTFEGRLRIAEVARRKRERAQRKEDRYAIGKLQRWVDEQMSRRGTYNAMTAIRLVRGWRAEYREKQRALSDAKPPDVGYFANLFSGSKPV
jgi:hypothetical protein